MASTTPSILEVKNLSNSYAGEPLLQNISFTLGRGEILCLLGPSGSGKTTLLRLLAGLEAEESGSIIYNGQDIKPIPPHKRNIGMMFQEYALFPHKNVRQNISFGLEMQNVSSGRKHKKIEEMLDLVGLAGYGQRKINELSGGERQRVALARSLAPEPQLLLLDEPLGSLDRTLRDRLTGEIRNILKRLGVTAVFVTHDQAEAFSVADKIAILHGGVLEQFDTPEQIYHAPRNQTVACFLGFKNLVKGVISADGTFDSQLGRLQLPFKDNTTGQTTLLLRPDAAKIIDISEMVECCLAGKVISRVFQGSSYRLTVEVNQLVLSFDMPLYPKPPEENLDVRLSINPAALLLIEK